jgi:hypothetical protein
MKKLLLIFILLAVVSMGSVQAQELLKMDNIPDETFLKPVETALLSYQNDFKKWPENIMALQNYANKTGHPLDLSAFGKITLERKSPDTVLIVYAIKNPEPYLSAYAITVINVKLTKGTNKVPNKEKTNVLEVSSLSPEQERLRNTLKTKMWPNELATP